MKTPEARTFLMFEGRAEEALNFYAENLEGIARGDLKRHGPEAGSAEGKIMIADFSIGDQHFRVSDSPIPHDFGFTPSVSIFLTFETEAEVDQAFAALSDGGDVLMPLNDYGFSRRFGWVNDRFGVSWQLSTKLD